MALTAEDLSLPTYISKSDDTPGKIIDAEYWNSLWQTLILQANTAQDVLKSLVDELNATIWDPTNGAEHIASPALNAEGAVTVHGQLLEHEDRLDSHAISINNLSGTYTSLWTQVQNLALGEISSYNHNGLSNRDVADAHPMSAITGLDALLAALDVNDIAYDETDSLADKLADMDAAILLASGVTDISHDGLTNRDSAASHPIGAIEYSTGVTLATKLASMDGLIATAGGNASALLSGALSAYNASRLGNQLPAYYQKAITISPNAASGGVDGDVWIQYA